MSKPKISEKDFQKAVIEYAELRQWMVYHVANVKGQLRSKTGKGFPDLCMARRGWCVFAELKSERGKLKDEQKEWIAALPAREGVVEKFVWRPSDWDEIVRVLR